MGPYAELVRPLSTRSPPLKTPLNAEPRRLYQQIAERLRALLSAGAFPAGSRLPAERDLAQQLGVSRPSVREALIALEVEGWIEVRLGSGVYALERSAHAHTPVRAATSASEWGPLELIRARRVVEGETAALAATLAKPHDLLAMDSAIAAMASLADQGTLPIDADRDFHMAIVEACGNAVLAETVQTFWASRRGPIFTRLGGLFESQASWRAAIAEHQAVRDAIAAHDAPAARAAMHLHMDRAHQRFSASWRRARAPKPTAATLSAPPRHERRHP